MPPAPRMVSIFLRGSCQVGVRSGRSQLSSRRRAEAIAATVQSVAPVLDVRIVNDKFTGQPRGFAFVHFASIADAARVLHAFNVRISNYGGSLTVLLGGAAGYVRHADSTLDPQSTQTSTSHSYHHHNHRDPR